MAAGIAVSAPLLDKNSLVCVDPFPFFFTRKVSVFLVAYPTIVVTVIVGIVTIYLGYKMVLIKKTVCPTITLNQNQQSRRNVRRVEDQVDVFVVIEDEDGAQERQQNIALPSDSNISKLFTMTKAALNVNYIMILCSLVGLVQATFSIIHQACGQTVESCEDFLTTFNWTIPLKIIFTLVGCFVFFQKLKKIEDL